MELQNVGILVAVISTVLSMLATGFMAAMSWVIKFNDLHHVEINQKEMVKELKEVKDKVIEISVDFAALHAACKARHNE